jgi:serine/threonine protein kinase
MQELQEIDKAFFDSHNFRFLNYIGRGGYGIIFLVYSVQYDQNFALKKVPTKKFRQSEVDCMRTIDNPSIVPLYDYYYYNEYVYLLMEFCPSSIDRELKKNGPYTGRHLRETAFMILNAIKCCHENKVAHNDIKPSNFLIDSYNRVKVCDFGLSSFIEDDALSSLFAGSLAFVAPEVLLKKPYDPFRSDIWSLGVTMYLLATATLPWKFQSGKALINSITSVPINYKAIQDKDFVALISSCLKLDPLQRPSVKELLESPIFVQIASKKQPFVGRLKTGKQTQSLVKINKLIIRPFSKTNFKFYPSLKNPMSESMPQVKVGNSS